MFSLQALRRYLTTGNGRLPPDEPAPGERQLSRIGVSQTQPEDIAGDLCKVPTTVTTSNRYTRQQHQTLSAVIAYFGKLGLQSD